MGQDLLNERTFILLQSKVYRLLHCVCECDRQKERERGGECVVGALASYSLVDNPLFTSIESPILTLPSMRWFKRFL